MRWSALSAFSITMARSSPSSVQRSSSNAMASLSNQICTGKPPKRSLTLSVDSLAISGSHSAMTSCCDVAQDLPANGPSPRRSSDRCLNHRACGSDRCGVGSSTRPRQQVLCKRDRHGTLHHSVGTPVLGWPSQIPSSSYSVYPTFPIAFKVRSIGFLV